MGGLRVPADNGLANLTAIIDVNRLGQRGPTRYGWDTEVYGRRIRAFGWHTIDIDGHDIGQIHQAYLDAAASERPTAILARTKKGKGVASVEDKTGVHGKPLPEPENAVAELGGRRSIRVRVALPEPGDGRPDQPSRPREPRALPQYGKGGEVATRTAYGEALAALGDSRPDVVAIDGEVGDSTRAEYFQRAHPERYFQCYIAEQQMVGTAVGLQACGWTPYVTTFAAFLTRAYDFVRMASVSRADLRLVGSHAGVSIGEDGPSQMGLEDIAAFRALWGSTILYPCDGNQTAHLVAAMADSPGICYLRTTRGNTPVIYEPDEIFPIGGSRVLRSSPDDQVTLVAAGITVHEALTAAERLLDDGLPARVIDLYSVKPIDAATLRQAAAETDAIVTVEDHWPRGGLADAVLEALADDPPLPRFAKLGVRTMPASAPPAEQLRQAGIDAEAIVETVRGLARSPK